MKKIDAIIDNKIFQNLFIWACFFIILLGAIQAENKFLVAFNIILLLAPAIYISNLFILPKLKQQPFLFSILFLVNTVTFSIISIYFISLYANQKMELKMFVNFLGIMFLALTFGTATKLAKDSFVRRQQEKEAELKLLKAQLNPHFLFNTLNNLYGLSVVKSDKLPNLMLKLSDLLRYSLYDTKETFVPLEKEIQYLENYISLEKIRLEDKTEIVFNKFGSFTNETIAPMLLIVFVENAFKHLSKELKSTVQIEINNTNDSLCFTCKNSFNKTETNKKQLESNKSGIGLQNARKRLNLIYPNNHKLTISNATDFYIVELKITHSK
ncbi:MAG: sensor histidine kinase [Flavobacteriaceae bacterium]|nr:sensor histidine kinase [Flavobacteriaceae bacterium]